MEVIIESNNGTYSPQHLMAKEYIDSLMFAQFVETQFDSVKFEWKKELK